MKRKSIVLIVSMLLYFIILCNCSGKVVEKETFGKITDSIEWNINNGVIEITGTGDIPSFDYFGDGNKAPWMSFENDIEEIVVGDGITAIGDFAFAFTAAKTVKLPETVRQIGDYAFYCNKELTFLQVPNELIYIGDNAFANCLEMSDISIPASVNVIGPDAFLNCVSLENISVDENNPCYTSVGGVLFDKDMTKLVTYPAGNKANLYTVPESVAVIGNNAFAYNKFLSSIEVPSNVKEIGEGAFAFSDNLSDIKLPVGIKQIPSKAFFSCKALAEFTVPVGVEIIGESAFANCSMLKDVVLPQSVTEIKKMVFSNCESLASVDLPDRITEILERAFAGCSSLMTVELPYMLENIDSMAFSYCTALDKLVVYDSLSTVKAFAFRGCGKLRDIEYGGTREMWKNVNVEGGNDYFIKAVVSFPNDLLDD